MKAGYLSLFFLSALSMTTAQAGFDVIEPCKSPSGLPFESNAAFTAQTAFDAGCSSQDQVFLLDAEQSYRRSVFKGAPIQKTVQGLPVTGLPAEIEYLEKALGTNETSIPQAWKKVPKTCKSVTCALTYLFGSRESALRALTIYNAHGYVLSASQTYKEAHRQEQLWSPIEVRKIHSVLEKLPPKFSHLSTLKEIHRLPQGQLSKANPKNCAEADSRAQTVVVLGNKGCMEENTDELFAHELVHHFDYSYRELLNGKRFHEVSSFMQISDWQLKERKFFSNPDGQDFYRDIFIHLKNDGFVTEHSAETPDEDLADSVAYYVYHPEKLKKVSQEKYDHLKTNVFDGKEYLPPSYFPEVEAYLSKTGQSWPTLFNRCLKELPYIGKGTKTEDYLLLQKDPKGGLPKGYPLNESDTFAEQLRCLNDTKKEVERALMDQPGFCLKVANNDLDRYFQHHLTRLMRPFASAVDRYLSKSELDHSITQCIKSKDLRLSCPKEELHKQITSFTHPNYHYEKNDYEELKQQLQRLIEDPIKDTWNVRVNQLIDPVQTSTLCLTDYDKVLVSPKETEFRKNLSGLKYNYVRNSSSLYAIDTCVDSLTKYLGQFGYQFKEDEINSVNRMKDTGARAILDKLDPAVLKPWKQAMSACGPTDTSCKTKVATRLVDNLLQDKKVLDPSYRKVLVEHLLKTVQIIDSL